jgi:hypothetical protein
MSLRPLFFSGKGRHGESHGEEKESQEENQVVLKLHARAFIGAAPASDFAGSLISPSG